MPDTSRRIVVTGGPGAGKTAVLELARKHFPKRVMVLPEAASLVFSGGFPREQGAFAKEAAQRAIYAVQRELERYAEGKPEFDLVLCDRGTVDGAAYWPLHTPFFESVGTTEARELERYFAVIHMHVPRENHGFDHSNRLRIETAEEAAQIDDAIGRAWQRHTLRFEVNASDGFMDKAQRAIALIASLLPTQKPGV